MLDTGEGPAAAKVALQLTQRAEYEPLVQLRMRRCVYHSYCVTLSSAGCKIGLGVWNKVIGAVSSLPLHTICRVHEPGEAHEGTVDQQLVGECETAC